MSKPILITCTGWTHRINKTHIHTPGTQKKELQYYDEHGNLRCSYCGGYHTQQEEEKDGGG